MTQEWNDHELDSLKMYMDMRNKVKKLSDETIRNTRKYRVFLKDGTLVSRDKSPVIDEDYKVCIDLYNSKKLDYLKDIYEIVHILDCSGSHDIALWCLQNTMNCFMDDFAAETEEEPDKIDFTAYEELSESCDVPIKRARID